MSDKPILFSGPMVRALLGGTKTQTRRRVKPDGLMVSGSHAAMLNPRIRVGDRLYVRETWTHTGTGVWTIADTHRALDGAPAFQADGALPGAKYWPSIHMPRRFSRLTLHVTDVRVEPLRDISEADALAEGIEQTLAAHDRQYAFSAPAPFNERAWDTAREAYAELWRRINGPTSWHENPWVAAYTFTVERVNIDQAARPLPLPETGISIGEKQ